METILSTGEKKEVRGIQGVTKKVKLNVITKYVTG